MTINTLKDFLQTTRDFEQAQRLKYLNQMKQKDKILRRIINSNLRSTGIAYRQSFQFTLLSRKTEQGLIFKQRGIIKRIVDSNVRLISSGFNKLIEAWKSKKNDLKGKIKYILKTLNDADARALLVGYNGLRARAYMLGGVGVGTSAVRKIE
jgi:hypothetical protein